MLEEEYIRPNIDVLEAEDAYKEAVSKVKNNDLSPNSIFETFLAERSLKVNEVRFEYSKSQTKFNFIR